MPITRGTERIAVLFPFKKVKQKETQMIAPVGKGAYLLNRCQGIHGYGNGRDSNPFDPYFLLYKLDCLYLL